MTPYGIKAVDGEPHGCPPWIIKVAVLCMAIFAVVILRMVLGLGAAYAYYRSAQDFASFVEEHPVSAEAVEAWLPDGELLAEHEPWTLGEPGSAPGQELAGHVDVFIQHGSEVLLDTHVELTLLVDPETWDRHQVTVSVPKIKTRSGMHAVVQVGLLDPPTVLGDGQTASGWVVVDVVLAAGERDSTYRVVELDERPASVDDTDQLLLPVRALMGLLHPSGELPEEGYLHQARAGLSMSWRKSEGGSLGISVQESQHRTNCRDYSFETKVTTHDMQGGRSTFSTSTSWAQTYTWNDKVW